MSTQTNRFSELASLFQIRELARSEPERKALTSLIREAFDHIGFPLDGDQERTGDIFHDPAPWLWIISEVFKSIETGTFCYPFKFEKKEGTTVLCIRLADVMRHIAKRHTGPAVARKSIETHVMLKRRLSKAGVLCTSNEDTLMSVERTINGKRVAHMVVLDLPALADFGVQVTAHQTHGSVFAPLLQACGYSQAYANVHNAAGGVA